MIPLKMRRLFFGFTPRAIAWNKRLNPRPLPVAKPKQVRPHLLAPRIRLTNPLNLNMVNWVLTLVANARRRRVVADPMGSTLAEIAPSTPVKRREMP